MGLLRCRVEFCKKDDCPVRFEVDLDDVGVSDSSEQTQYLVYRTRVANVKRHRQKYWLENEIPGWTET